MFHILEKQILETVSNHIQARYGVDVAVTLEQPKQASFGELAVPVAFQLAKQLKRAPKQIAAELADDLAGMPGVESLEVAGNGYLNIRLDRGTYGFAVLTGRDAVVRCQLERARSSSSTRTSIPTRPRTSGIYGMPFLGDTFVRMLRSAGRSVEVQNYIDNTGVQVADVVVGFHYLEKKSRGEVRGINRSGPIRLSTAGTCTRASVRITRTILTL